MPDADRKPFDVCVHPADILWGKFRYLCLIHGGRYDIDGETVVFFRRANERILTPFVRDDLMIVDTADGRAGLVVVERKAEVTGVRELPFDA